MRDLVGLNFISVALLVLTACQADPPPVAPSALSAESEDAELDVDDDEEPVQKKRLPSASSPQVSSAKTFKFGAPVGSQTLRQKVNACNESGMFFDRLNNQCSSSVKLVEDLSCTERDLLAHPDVGAEGMKSIDAFKAQHAGKTFYFDQCAQTTTAYWTIYLIADDLKFVTVCVGPTCPKI